jgi:hypothetical protein
VNPIFRAVKATYYFLAGDMILIAAVTLAFLLAATLLRTGAANALVAVLFVACIVGGLMTTLARERRG